METSCGKLLIYVPRQALHSRRVKVVKAAVKETAKTLSLDFEVVVFKENTPIYVFFKNGAEEPVPLYCDSEDGKSLEQVRNALRGMMFVLSFHPKYAALKRMRMAIMRFS